jgi:hypothetical protein
MVRIVDGLIANWREYHVRSDLGLHPGSRRGAHARQHVHPAHRLAPRRPRLHGRRLLPGGPRRQLEAGLRRGRRQLPSDREPSRGRCPLSTRRE